MHPLIHPLIRLSINEWIHLHIHPIVLSPFLTPDSDPDSDKDVVCLSPGLCHQEDVCRRHAREAHPVPEENQDRESSGSDRRGPFLSLTFCMNFCPYQPPSSEIVKTENSQLDLVKIIEKLLLICDKPQWTRS